MKLKKALAALVATADSKSAGHLAIRKKPEGWIIDFLPPLTLQSDQGDAPLPTFTAAALRALAKMAVPDLTQAKKRPK